MEGRKPEKPDGPSRKPKNESAVEVQLKERTNEATIFITVDNSGSMAGSKMTQVISSIQQIFEKLPPYSRLTFRSFADDVRLLVRKKKMFLDFERAMEGLRKVGGRTALYDAWGQTIEQIDHKLFRSQTDNIYVLIFTDGEDNASKTHTLDTVSELVREKLQYSNFYHTFIQAGSEQSPAIQHLHKRFGSQPRCNILTVEDSAEGIKIAFEKVSQQIQVVLRINVLNQEIPKALASSIGNVEKIAERMSERFSRPPSSGDGTAEKNNPKHKNFRRDQGSYHNRNRMDEPRDTWKKADTPRPPSSNSSSGSRAEDSQRRGGRYEQPSQRGRGYSRDLGSYHNRNKIEEPYAYVRPAPRYNRNPDREADVFNTEGSSNSDSVDEADDSGVRSDVQPCNPPHYRSSDELSRRPGNNSNRRPGDSQSYTDAPPHQQHRLRGRAFRRDQGSYHNRNKTEYTYGKKKPSYNEDDAPNAPGNDDIEKDNDMRFDRQPFNPQQNPGDDLSYVFNKLGLPSVAADVKRAQNLPHSNVNSHEFQGGEGGFKRNGKRIFNLRIDNLPADIQIKELVNKYSGRFGCRVIGAGQDGSNSQWIILSYDNESDRNQAVFGLNFNVIGDNVVKVSTCD